MSAVVANQATAYIQSLLDQRGVVRLEKPETYMINKTLIIHADTRLELAPGVKLIAAPDSRCALLQNEHFAGGGRDANISVIGGIWDGNCDQMGLDPYYMCSEEQREHIPYSVEGFRGKLIRFAHVDHIALEKMTVKDPVSYGIQIADVVGFVTRDLHFDFNCHFGTTDGVHINGPAHFGVIENLYGTTNDDLVSLTTEDEPHAEITRGEIADVVIRNISATNGYSGVRLLAAKHPIWCVHIDGIYGDFRHNAVIISRHNFPDSVHAIFEDITIENVHAHKTPVPLGEGCFRLWENGAIERAPMIQIRTNIEIGSLTLCNIFRRETTQTAAPLVRITESVHIQRLYVDNVSQALAEGVEAPLWQCAAAVDTYVGQQFD